MVINGIPATHASVKRLWNFHDAKLTCRRNVEPACIHRTDCRMHIMWLNVINMRICVGCFCWVNMLRFIAYLIGVPSANSFECAVRRKACPQVPTYGFRRLCRECLEQHWLRLRRRFLSSCVCCVGGTNGNHECTALVCWQGAGCCQQPTLLHNSSDTNHAALIITISVLMLRDF